MRILFTCGGTGGHIYPAVALHQAFREKVSGLETLFVGSDYGLEKEIFRREGIRDFRLTKARGFFRNMSPYNFVSAVCNIIALFQTRRILAEFQPDCVISTGAYPTLHVTYHAVRRGIPVFLVEGNAVPGLVARLFARRYTAVFAASASLSRHLGSRATVIRAALPARKADPSASAEDILKRLGLNRGSPVVTIIGGSCGAERINECALGIINDMAREYQIV